MFFKRNLKSIGVLFVALMAACGDGSKNNEEQTVTESDVEIVGAVQKGPFVIGSTVTVNRLSSDAVNTDSTVITNTIDDLGRFNFSLDEGSDLIELSATGYYRNEITGELSQGTITLRSVIGLSDQEEQTAYINPLTHLTSQRIRSLISESDLQFEDAQSQAESEFLIAFSEVIPNSAENDFTSLSIYDDELSSGSSYLLAVSSILYRYALSRSNINSTNPDAELTLLLNELEADFGEDGAIGDTPLLESLRAIIPEIDPSIVSSNVDDWIDGLDGFERVDINEYLDTDLDGVFNLLDTDDDNDGIEDEFDTSPYQQSFIVTDQEVEVNEDQSVEVDIETNNPLDTEVSVEILSSASNGVVSGSYPNLTYTPNANFEGIDTFSYQLTQGEISSEIATVSLSIVGENDAPSIAGTPTTEFMAHNAYSFVPTISDIENDSLELSIQNLPIWASFNDQTGEISGSPTNDDVGLYENILLSANDGNLTTEYPSFNIEVKVNPYELGFLVGNQEIETDEDSSINIDISSNNPLGIDIDLTISQSPSYGSVQGDYPELIYTPNENYNGVDTFKYRLSQDIIVSGEVTININTLPVNDAPTISVIPVNNNIAALEDFSLTPISFDVDGDELEFSVQNLPSWASFDQTTGEINGIPVNENAGNYEGIVVTVDDGELLSDSNLFSIEVMAVPWLTGASIPIEVDRHSSSLIDGVIYLFGGIGGAFPWNDVYAYSIADNSWEVKAPMPEGVYIHQSVALDGKAYIFGGLANSDRRDLVQIYDPEMDSWSNGSPMPTGRYGSEIEVVNGKIYVIGGRNESSDMTNIVEEYDPLTDSWSTKTAAPRSCTDASSAALDGKIYIIGGCHNTSETTVDIYVPESDSWEFGVPMILPRSGLVSETANGKIYAISGYEDSSSNDQATVQEFDPVVGEWALKTEIPLARHWASSVSYEGKIYIMGGGYSTSSQNLTSDHLDIYDPSLDP